MVQQVSCLPAASSVARLVENIQDIFPCRSTHDDTMGTDSIRPRTCMPHGRLDGREPEGGEEEKSVGL
jgi:hypothetical protein